MVKQTKLYAVEDLVAKFKAAKTTALVDYQGISAEQITDLREKIKEAGGQVQVIKNTLISRALANLGITLEEKLTGPTALVFANEDEISPLQIIAKVAKELEKPKFKLGVYQNKIISDTDIERFVKLPPKEVLLAQFVGGLNNPLFRLVYALRFNQTKLVLILKQIAEKGGEQNG